MAALVHFVVYVWLDEYGSARSIAVISTENEKFVEAFSEWGRERGYRVEVKRKETKESTVEHGPKHN